VQAPVEVVLDLCLDLFSMGPQYVLVGALVMHHSNVAKVARCHEVDLAKLFFA
jgi:hypothetical protein